jgi:2,4-dienoyl-CoA reductase-like NADH-dependent reductase (Old Yellow Enzyme family)
LRSEDEECYFAANASAIKAAVRVTVFALGGVRTLAVAERLVREGRADLVSLSRPLIRDPFLVKHFREGLTSKSECISCNKCFNPRGIRCAELKKKS